MDALEHRRLVEGFVALADAYEIPSETLIRWANVQADDFENWPRRPGMQTPQRYLRSAITYPGTFALPRAAVARMHTPKRKQRPNKRERMHKLARS